MLASASLGEDAALLDLLVEATQGAFERLVLTHSDFCQSRFTSPGQGSRMARVGRTACRPGRGPDGRPVRGWRSIAEPSRTVKPQIASRGRAPHLVVCVRRPFRFRPVPPAPLLRIRTPRASWACRELGAVPYGRLVIAAELIEASAAPYGHRMARKGVGKLGVVPIGHPVRVWRLVPAGPRLRTRCIPVVALLPVAW